MLRTPKSTALVPILNQIYRIHNIQLYFSKIHFNPIFPTTVRSPQWSFSFWLLHQNPICIHSICIRFFPYAIPSAHLILPDLIILIIFGGWYSADGCNRSTQAPVKSAAVLQKGCHLFTQNLLRRYFKLCSITCLKKSIIKRLCTYK